MIKEKCFSFWLILKDCMVFHRFRVSGFAFRVREGAGTGKLNDSTVQQLHISTTSGDLSLCVADIMLSDLDPSLCVGDLSLCVGDIMLTDLDSSLCPGDIKLCVGDLSLCVKDIIKCPRHSMNSVGDISPRVICRLLYIML